MLLVIVQYPSLCISLFKAPCPSRQPRASHSFVISKLAKYSTPAPRPLTKMLNRTHPQIEPWGSLLAVGSSSIHCNSLRSTVQPVHHLAWSEPVYPTVGQFVQEDIVRSSIKGLPEIQKDSVLCLPPSQQTGDLIIEEDHISKA